MLELLNLIHVSLLYDATVINVYNRKFMFEDLMVADIDYFLHLQSATPLFKNNGTNLLNYAPSLPRKPQH
jgi:hypothetical protein